MTSQLETLTQINLDDLVSSFGWQDYPLLASALRRIFNKPARMFAEQMVSFDNAVGESDLAEASRRLMRTNYVRDVRVHGASMSPPMGLCYSSLITLAWQTPLASSPPSTVPT
jgi:hypothetical protein